MKSVSIRLGTTSRFKYGNQCSHDLRTGHQPEYVDKNRMDLNSYIIEPPDLRDLEMECLQRRQSRTDLKRKAKSLKSDAAVGVRGIITFSHEAQKDIEALSYDVQNELFEKCAMDIAAQYNTDLIGLSVHRDESAIHAHMMFTGYDKNGNPLSKKLTKSALSKSQDVGAQAFDHLGIKRGKSKILRMEEGEDPSAYINRSVGELHADLPRELAAAREKVEKLNEQVSKLEKELEEVKLPAAQRGEMIIEKKLLTHKTQQIEFYHAPRVQAGMKKAAAQRAAAEKEAEEARRLLKDQQEDLERMKRREQRLKELMLGWATVSADVPHIDLSAALERPIQQRYGVSLQTQDDGRTVTAPPQEASPRQIAAALYRAVMEQGWKLITLSSDDEIALHFLEFAQADGIAQRVRFERQVPEFKEILANHRVQPSNNLRPKT